MSARAAPNARLVAAWVSVFVLLLGVACAGGRGHPVRLSRPRFDPEEARAWAAPAVDEPTAPSAAEARGLLFRGLEGVLRPLERLRALPLTDPRQPIVAPLPRIERAVLDRYRGGGFGGPVRFAVAIGATGVVPLQPRAAIALWMDAEVERTVLEADAFRMLAPEYTLAGAQRVRYLLALRRVGRGPFRYDLRVVFAMERWDVADGSILLRYDPRPEVAPEHITLFRGGCLIEPHERGARLTELVIVGTDIRLPFFLVGAARDVVRERLGKRSRRLWRRAWDARGR